MEKLFALFYNDISLLDMLSEHGIITGGAIVYALMDTVKLRTVGDIDIFIKSEYDFNTLIRVLDSDNTVYESLTDALSTGISIINVKTSRAMLPVQLIYRKFDNPMEILNTFDLDYVQCGYYKGTLYQTDLCKKAHASCEISHLVSLHIKGYRLIKAMNKGFRVPLLGTGTFEIPKHLTYSVNVEDILNTNKQQAEFYLDNINTPNICMDTNRMTVVQWKKTKQERFYANLITFGKFIINSDDAIIETENISCVVYVEDFVVFEQLNCRYIGILRLKDIPEQISIIDKFKIEHNEKSISPGKYVIVFSVYNNIYNPKQNTYKRYIANVKKIYSTDNIKLLQFGSNIFSEHEEVENSIQYKNDGYVKVRNLIKFHQNSKHNLSHQKKYAYTAFLYYIEEKHSKEIYAINMACKQMLYDIIKQRSYKLDTSTMWEMAIALEQKTLDDMIHYIEGF